MRKEYTPFEWICIDIANQNGLDKKLFEERVQWVKDNMNQLMVLATETKERPLYVKAVMAMQKAMRGQPTGHLVGLDATCSGMSIMSVLTKCYNGCLATNLIDPNVRNDAYTMVTDAASEKLWEGVNQLVNPTNKVSRADAKDATMTALYGSQATPREIFGEDTPELDAFYAGLEQVAPLAVELLGDLRSAWQPFALKHSWILPDNFHVVIPVMQKVEGARVEVDELGHSTFSYDYYVNEGTKKDLKLVANVTHGFDAYLVRSMERRCNYNPFMVRRSLAALIYEQAERDNGDAVEQHKDGEPENLAEVLVVRWFASRVPDARLFDVLTSQTIKLMDDLHIEQMIRMANEMLKHKPFEIVTVHDEFKCHPNNCNQMCFHYASILADLARGRALEDVLEQITGHTPHYDRAMDGNELAELIMESRYAIS